MISAGGVICVPLKFIMCSVWGGDGSLITDDHESASNTHKHARTHTRDMCAASDLKAALSQLPEEVAATVGCCFVPRGAASSADPLPPAAPGLFSAAPPVLGRRSNPLP